MRGLEMASYSSSQKTINSLIAAAGELFAEHGIEAVTTRAIAKKAKENIGNIHYHFGSKEGLLDAALDFSCSLWNNDPFGKFLEDNRKLLKTSAGQIKLVSGLIDIFFEIIFSNEKPLWCGTLIFQILQRNLDVSSKILKNLIIPNTKAFVTVYRSITKDNDFENAYCWYLNMVSSAVLCSMNQNTLEKIHPEGILSERFIPKLKKTATVNALKSLGLKVEKIKFVKSKNIMEI
jgi:AcrR family transcriptional regulator